MSRHQQKEHDDNDNNVQVSISQKIEIIEQKLHEAKQQLQQAIEKQINVNMSYIISDLNKELEDVLSKYEELKDKNDELTDKKQKTKKEVAELKKAIDSQKLINDKIDWIAGENSKKPILVICDAKTIKITAEDTHEFKLENKNDFIQFCKNRVDSDVYCLVFMIKPSSVKYSYDLTQKMMKLGYNVGWDPLNENITFDKSTKGLNETM